MVRCAANLSSSWLKRTRRQSAARGLAATGGRPLFPLLVKLIDAAQNLSVQVHPHDAAAPPDCLGKTEAWHVLEADAGAAVALGLRLDVLPEEFAAGCRAGWKTAELLR
jgi:mannose-6-phosphate isomerase